MTLIVQKFGGTSVGDIERLKHVAKIIEQSRQQGKSVVVVVSAMAGVTNQLASYIHAAMPVQRYSQTLQESDVILSAGEQVTSGLLSLCLQERGIPARSFTAWQLPFVTDDHHTNANVLTVECEPLKAFLNQGGVSVVAGFQGIHEGRITTLGRGGSDMTAVALAHALGADYCDIYTDVAGVYTADPRLIGDAEKIDTLTFEEMQLLAEHGAKVLQPKCIAYAFEKNVRLRVLSSFDHYACGTEIVFAPVQRKRDLSGIAHSFNDVKIRLRSLPLTFTHAVRQMCHALTEEGIHYDGFAKDLTEIDDNKMDISFLVTKADLVPMLSLLNKQQKNLGFSEIHVDQNIVKISLIGQRLKDDFLFRSRILKTLNERLISAEVAGTMGMKITLTAAENQARQIVQLLHDHLIKEKYTSC